MFQNSSQPDSTSDKPPRVTPGSSEDLPEDWLDEQLLQARWPEVEQEAVVRLQRVFESAVRANSTIRESAGATASLRGSFRTFRNAAILVPTLLCVSFLAGRWVGIRSASFSSASSATHSVELQSSGEVNDTGPDAGTSQSDVAASERTETAEDTDTGTARSEKMDVSPADSDQATASVIAHAESSSIPEVPAPQGVPAPQEDPVSRSRSISRRDQYRQQLDAVLTCLAEQNEAGQEQQCVQPLLARRAEFEYLLWEVIGNSTGQQRLTALTAVGLIGSPRSVPLLMKSSRNEDLRSASISALKHCADEATLTGFVMQQQDVDLAAEFAIELAHRPTLEACQAWLHLVNHGAARRVCLQAAGELHPALVERLFLALDAPLVSDRIAAAMSLGARTDPATTDRLISLVDRFPHRWEPVAALMWNGSTGAVQALNRLQKDTSRIAVLQTAGVQLQAFAVRDSFGR